MEKGYYDFNILSDCQKHFKKFKEVVCSGYTVNQFFTHCMMQGIKIQVERDPITNGYKFTKL